MKRHWTDGTALSVRACNVIADAGWESPEAIRKLEDRDILRQKNAGRRVLEELRANGLRPDSCSVPCILTRGHTGPHVPLFKSTFVRQPVSVLALPVPPSPHDLGTLLLFSLRYALGRRSSAPSDVADMVRRYWGAADTAHRGFLLRDLREGFERAFRLGDGSDLGDECDRQTWAALLIWMYAQEGR